jgi:hypothetical protein
VSAAGALEMIAEAIARARAGKAVSEIPRAAVFSAMGTDENSFLNRALASDPEAYGPKGNYPDSPLAQLLHAQNVALRVEPPIRPGLAAYSPLAHYDATGGQQLWDIPRLWASNLDSPRSLQHVRGFRALDLNAMPSNSLSYSDDPFIYEGHANDVGRREGYGAYSNASEGLTQPRWLGDPVPPDASWLDLLNNPVLRAQNNVSVFVPRRSPLYTKPLFVARARGGSV